MARRPRRTRHRRTAALRLRLAPCCSPPVGGAVRHCRILRARPLGPRARADAVERVERVRAARHAGCALLSHRRISIVRCHSPAWRCCSPRSYALATETLLQRDGRPGHAWPQARCIATGALAALALALTFALEKGWLTVALALMAPGAAWIAEKAAAAVAALARRHHGRAGDGARRLRAAHRRRRSRHGADLQLAAVRLRRSRRVVLARGLAAAAPAPTICRRARSMPPPFCSRCCWSIVEIRHYVTGGDIYRPSADFVEIALYVNVGLAMTIGLERVRGRTGSIVHNIGAHRHGGADACSPSSCDLVYVLDPRSQPHVRSAARSSI